jgi:hypothetical protein
LLDFELGELGGMGSPFGKFLLQEARSDKNPDNDEKQQKISKNPEDNWLQYGTQIVPPLL